MMRNDAIKSISGLLLIAATAWAASFVAEWVLPAAMTRSLHLHGGTVYGSAIALYLLLTLCGCGLALVALFDRGTLGFGAWALRGLAATIAIGYSVATWAWAAGVFAPAASVAGAWAAPGPLGVPLVLATLVPLVAGIWLMGVSNGAPVPEH